MIGRIETRTRDMIYCQTIRPVRYISRDDRARIATCRLRTLTDRLKENYIIDDDYYDDYYYDEYGIDDDNDDDDCYYYYSKGIDENKYKTRSDNHCDSCFCNIILLKFKIMH